MRRSKKRKLTANHEPARPRRQPEPFYLDEKGERHDDGLHDEMLNNPEADAAFQRIVIEDARKRGVSEAAIQRLYGNQNTMSKKAPSRTELMKQITNTILHGKGIQKRIAADAAKPIISSRNDGVRYDPAWQDDIIGRPKKGRK